MVTMYIRYAIERGSVWNNVFNGTKAEVLPEPEKESAAMKEMIFLRLNEYRKKVEDTICWKTNKVSSFPVGKWKETVSQTGPVLDIVYSSIRPATPKLLKKIT